MIDDMANEEYIRWLKLLDDELTFDGLVDGKDKMDMHEMIFGLCKKLEQEQKTGHWEDCSNGWMCSNCCRDVSHESDFCPYCGAKMEVWDEDT